MSRMNKKERRNLFMRIGAVLIVICMVAALALPAFAADTDSDNEPYKYTVRIFPGDKGTIGSDPIVKEVEANYEWSRSDFDCMNQASVKDEYNGRYYVTGMRESGRDNNTNVKYQSGNFTVDRDIDLVVSYGIKGSDVPYTINYVDYGSGDAIHESETYYGNDGDRPAIAYLYVEGYIPQYEILTGTIKAGSDNEWTFYYVKAEDDSDDTTSTQSSGVTTQSTGGTSTSSGTSTGSSSTSSGTSTGSSTSSGTSTSSNSTGTTASNETSATSVGEPTTLASNGTVNTRKNGPVEIVDLDEQDIPLVEYDSSNADSNVEQNADELINRETEGVVRAEGMSTPVKVILGAAVVIVIAAAGWFLYKKSSFEE